MKTQILYILVLFFFAAVGYAATEGGAGIGDHTFSNVDVVGALTAGTVASDGAVSGTAITGTSFVIGANSLSTDEWAYLDSIDQNVDSGADVIFGSIDVSGGTIEVPNGTDLPATCAIGQLFVDSDDDSCADVGGGAGALCVCTAVNTWSTAT